MRTRLYQQISNEPRVVNQQKNENHGLLIHFVYIFVCDSWSTCCIIEMLQTTWIALVLGFWSSLYLLDAFLKVYQILQKTQNKMPYLPFTSGSLQPLLVNHTYVCRTISHHHACVPGPPVFTFLAELCTLHFFVLFSRSHAPVNTCIYIYTCRCSLFIASKKVRYCYSESNHSI